MTIGLQEITDLFDRIYVISLASSRDRRRHIRTHLPTMGLNDFGFFDATPADDQSVAAARASGEVFQYPPCFRCGELDCGRPDCNNFLTAPQIANFLTYRRLWRAIAEGEAERVLILEDDVFLHQHTSNVLAGVLNEVQDGRLPFVAGQTCLLRLGWAKCPDHEGNQFRVEQTVKMANPCHALTRNYATALLERETGITHTSDAYIHRLAPCTGEAFTVFPPMASELSWTEGVFASTIHPKQIRLERLRAEGRVAEFTEEANRFARHVRKKHFRPILICGHPRCGTGFAAALARRLGLDVRHDALGAAGISSWMFAVDADENPAPFDAVAKTRRALAWEYLVMPVRDIYRAAASVIRHSRRDRASYLFRRNQILEKTGVDLDRFDTELEQAVWSIIEWTRILLDQEPSLIFRIEDQHDHLQDFLIQSALIDSSANDKRRDLLTQQFGETPREVEHATPTFSAEDWQALPQATRDARDWYCQRFGYSSTPH